MTQRIVMSLKPDTAENVKRMAEEDGRTVSSFIHQMIKSYLLKKKKKKKKKK